MGRPIKDLTGQVFGQLTVLNPIKGSGGLYLCQCSCGESKAVRGQKLREGKAKSCGCRHRNIEDLEGSSQGLLSYVKEAGNDIRGDRVIQCLCACGVTTTVSAKNYMTGISKSCGCYRKKVLSEVNKGAPNLKQWRNNEHSK